MLLAIESAAGSSIDTFKEVLPKLGVGLLGIFIVTAIIIVSIILLNSIANGFARRRNNAAMRRKDGGPAA